MKIFYYNISIPFSQTEDGQEEQPEVLPPGWERCEGKNSLNVEISFIISIF